MGPFITAAVDMLDFFERQRDWSYETFGPKEVRGPMGPLDHLRKEAAEAHEEARKATALEPGWDMDKLREEIADCLFLVFDAAHRSGMSYSELARVAVAKLKKNQARDWPDWQQADPNKAVEHDRSNDPPLIT